MSSSTTFSREPIMPCNKPIRLLTVVFIIEQNRILLGMKKRGFGVGKWNGFGGKVDLDNETIEEGAQRELKEECGITALDMEQRGIIFFEFDDVVEKHVLEVHVFVATKYDGTIMESEEMLPEWYNINDIPYRFMWADDIHWFPIMLMGKRFRAHFIFSDFKTIKSFEVQLIPET